MRLLIIIVFYLYSCSNKPQIKTVDSNIVNSDTSEPEIDFRKEFIAYSGIPTKFDTSFIKDQINYRVHFRHYCMFDSALMIPSRYNIDTNLDFVTHNFRSEFVLLSNQDTVLNKLIEKVMFSSLLDSSVRKYGTLLFPYISIERDSIEINYSITIPVTDVGIPVKVKFDLKGNYSILN